MSKFLMLPWETPDAYAGMGPEEMQRIVQRYIAWTDSLRDGGHLLSSDKLRDGEGRTLSRETGDMVVRDGPYPETKEVIGGFWLVRADSYDHAVELARDCPHLEFGRLEIRQIEEL